MELHHSVNQSDLHAPNNACTQPADNNLTDGASLALVRTSLNITWVCGIKAALERRVTSTKPPTPNFVDTAGVISMLEDVTMKSANKHIFKTLAEARERVNLDKSAITVKVDTKANLANAMPKQEPDTRESAAQLRQIAEPRPAKPPDPPLALISVRGSCWTI
jgi:hypothetical protein